MRCEPNSGCCSKTDSYAYDPPLFIEDEIDTPIGKVPRIKTELEKHDSIGRIMMRLSEDRNNYRVEPGIYAVGKPDDKSPVLVTANYKLTFDEFRVELEGIDAWILILDSRGVNVWCAAGKGTFGTDELVKRICEHRLDKLVSHRQVIVPQLGATGIAAHEVKKSSGFNVIYGPIRAKDIPEFLSNKKQATPKMRQVTFIMHERLVLIPLELLLIGKYLLMAFIISLLISGIGREVFSIDAAILRGRILVTGLLTGVLSGLAVTPALLPWIPGRAFSIKGLVSGLALSAILLAIFWNSLRMGEAWSIVLCVTALSSYLAMDFTGSTPYTSPSGVEWEMRRAIPMQVIALVFAIALWIGGGFVR